MASKKKTERAAAIPAAIQVRDKAPAGHWMYAAAAAAVLVLGFWVYSPALNGPFLFDDTSLLFALPGFNQPLSVWLRNVRPVLYLTYWMNAQISGDNPYSYHVLNVFFHCITTGLIFLIVRRLLASAKVDGARRDVVAGFAAGIFLLHPVQTEAVAYLAGRSESLSVMLGMAAFALFLYRRRTAISWPAAAAVLVLFGAALLSKEHIIALPALFLLTDYWWNPGFSLAGIRANWRLYLPMALGGAAGLAFFWRLIMTAETAGFGMKDLTWYQYFFTQCRALFVYLGTFLLPVNLTVDWDFPISMTILDRGAIFGLLALVGLAGAAWFYRRRFPLASYGFFAYLILMAPTSSVLPIRDPIADRRLYFSMLGLLLIVTEVLVRVRMDRKILATVCVVVLAVSAGAAHARARVWSEAVLLWEDTVQKSPNKPRVRFHLAFAYYELGRFAESIAEFEKAAKLETPTYNMLVDWALAHDSLNQPDQALDKLRQAAGMEATGHVYSQIGMVYAKRQKWSEALEALANAEKLDPGFPTTYLYRGKIYIATNQPALAVPSLQRALALDPRMAEARQELMRAEQMLRAPAVSGLRIGVNALYLIPGGVGGTEIYLRSMLAALAEIDRVNHYFVFTNRETGSELGPPAPNFTCVPQAVRASSRPARILWEQVALPIAAARLGLDVLWNPGFTAPLACPCPQVTVFHDLQHKRHPEYFRWFELPFWNFFLFWSAHVSRLVLAVSDATAQDLLKYYRLPESKVRVAAEGVDPVFFDLAARRKPERFLLAVSTLHPHKNLDGLLRAFAIFRATHPDFRLVVCGLHGFFTGPLHELRDKLGLRESVEFPGWIPREDLYDLFTRAWAFVYPSLFEGFGLPVLEALAAGVPSACSNIQPVAGIAADAALQFDPRSVPAIADALERITDDEALRTRLADRGPERASEFSWKQAAEETLGAIAQVV